jgi:hypothetical protein
MNEVVEYLVKNGVMDPAEMLDAPAPCFSFGLPGFDNQSYLLHRQQQPLMRHSGIATSRRGNGGSPHSRAERLPTCTELQQSPMANP